MMLQIPAFLDAHTLTAFRDLSEKRDLFSEGNATAGWHARQNKHNLQADHPLAAGLLKKVEQLLLANPLVISAARPKVVVRMLLSRYECDMYYGNHVDDALMAGERTDVSFTLFLSAPETYQGGALVVDEPAGERVIKPEAGSLFLYPSTALHRVEPVTDGVRVAVVGWLRSYIRDAHQRELLFDLDRSVELCRQRQDASAEGLSLLLKTRSNLLRMWVES